MMAKEVIEGFSPHNSPGMDAKIRIFLKKIDLYPLIVRWVAKQLKNKLVFASIGSAEIGWCTQRMTSW